MSTLTFSKKRQKTQERRKLRSKGTLTKLRLISQHQQDQVWVRESLKAEIKEDVMIISTDIIYLTPFVITNRKF